MPSPQGYLRAFRPSWMGEPDEMVMDEAELLTDQARQARVRLYCARAKAGQPLFDSQEASLITGLRGARPD